MPPVTPLARRYAYKLAANAVSLLANLAIEAIASRALGPRGYGNYQFLTGFFQQVFSLLDLGVSTAFFTKAAQRPRDGKVVRFYWGYLSAVAVGVLSLIAMALVSGFDRDVWPGQESAFVLLAATVVLAIQSVTAAGKMTDAYGLTVEAERARVMQRLLLALGVVIAYAAGWLGLGVYFVLQAIAAALLCAALGKVLHGTGRALFGSRIGNADSRGKLIREYFSYSHPLAVHALVGTVAALIDLWLLQRFGGAAEQGYYGLALRISAVCLVFTTAMTPLLMREFSVACAARDTEGMAALYRRHVPVLFAITASLSCFVAVNAAEIIVLVGGAEFAAGTTALILLAFYPLQQTFGQITASVFLATDDTRRYRNIGVGINLAGLPLSYLLIGPDDLLGLNAGSIGLAIKTLLVGFIAVGIQLALNADRLKLDIRRFLGQQLVILFSMMALALATAGLTGRFLADAPVAIRLVTGGAAYVLLSAAALASAPALFGLSRHDVRSARASVMGRLRESRKKLP